ncbi:unnamed protein product [Cochlearia groenlandica]
MHEWKQKWCQGKDKPSGLNLYVWIGLQNYWITEEAVVTAKINSKNRKGGDVMVDKASGTHNAGANTFEEIADHMVMRKTHTNKATGLIDNPKFRDIVERVDNRLTQLSQSQLGNSYGSGKPFDLGTLPQSQEMSFTYVPNSDPGLLQKISKLRNELQEKDNAFNRYRQNTDAQLENMNAFLRTQFSQYRGPGGPGDASGSRTMGEDAGI